MLDSTYIGYIYRRNADVKLNLTNKRLYIYIYIYLLSLHFSTLSNSIKSTVYIQKSGDTTVRKLHALLLCICETILNKLRRKFYKFEMYQVLRRIVNGRFRCLVELFYKLEQILKESFVV